MSFTSVPVPLVAGGLVNVVLTTSLSVTEVLEVKAQVDRGAVKTSDLPHKSLHRMLNSPILFAGRKDPVTIAVFVEVALLDTTSDPKPAMELEYRILRRLEATIRRGLQTAGLLPGVTVQLLQVPSLFVLQVCPELMPANPAKIVTVLIVAAGADAPGVGVTVEAVVVTTAREAPSTEMLVKVA